MPVWRIAIAVGAVVGAVVCIAVAPSIRDHEAQASTFFTSGFLLLVAGLVFAMVARHFLDEDELVKLLANQPDHGEEDARALLRQMAARNYNPPTRERILEWQAQQDFPICPTPDDPGSCNVYGELRFPDDIYDQIGEFWEERAQEAH